MKRRVQVLRIIRDGHLAKQRAAYSQKTQIKRFMLKVQKMADENCPENRYLEFIPTEDEIEKFEDGVLENSFDSAIEQLRCKPDDLFLPCFSSLGETADVLNAPMNKPKEIIDDKFLKPM